MSTQFKEIISPNDLLSLPKFKAYIKLMVDGISTDPFNMSTIPLPTPENSDITKETVRKQSRQRYSVPKEQLENLIKTWSNKSFSPIEKVMEKAKKEGIKNNSKIESKKEIEKKESELDIQFIKTKQDDFKIEETKEQPIKNTDEKIQEIVDETEFNINDINL
jgi:hypothetical protein